MMVCDVCYSLAEQDLSRLAADSAAIEKLDIIRYAAGDEDKKYPTHVTRHLCLVHSTHLIALLILDQ